MGVDAKQIVLIGPDCSGKSTLAKQLSEHYRIPVKANRRIADDLDAAVAVLDFVREEIRSGNSFVLDQWPYPVDIVYNMTLRGKPSPITHLEPLMLPILKRSGVVFIHVDADEATLRERYAVRGDELWSVEQIVQVAKAYREFFNSWNFVAYRVDTSGLKAHQVAARAIKLISDHYWRRKNG